MQRYILFILLLIFMLLAAIKIAASESVQYFNSSVYKIDKIADNKLIQVQLTFAEGNVFIYKIVLVVLLCVLAVSNYLNFFTSKNTPD